MNAKDYKKYADQAEGCNRLSGYAVTQTIAGVEQSQATGVGFAIGAILAVQAE